MRSRLLSVLALSAALSAGAEERRDSLGVAIEFNSSISSNDALRPMWSYSQEWGRYTQYKGSDASAYAKLAYGWHNRWLHIGAGAALEASRDANQTMLHEAYVCGRIWKIDFTVGKQAFTPIEQRGGGLGLGTYIMSDNARPSPRAGAGFFDWRAVPGLAHWIEIKGGIFIGALENEDNPSFTKNVMTHEKFAYLRLGHFPVKPYLGLLHSVYMGGTTADGTEIPVDFWASFFARGSQKLKDAGMGGEYYNAAGGHNGMWDLGLDFETGAIDASLYYQRPFIDVTALNLFKFSACRDYMLGTSWRLRDFKPLSGITLEYFTTFWQGGNGIADPVFVSTGPERKGEVISLCPREVTPDLMRKYLGPQVKEWEASAGHALAGDECMDFLARYIMPEGWSWGNRSPYLQNYLYPQGWTVGGLSSGFPLFLSDRTMSVIDPGSSYDSRFPNVRLWAVNVGLSGNILPQLDWKFKFTFTENYGHYRDQYCDGADFWKKRPGYYFPDEGLDEFYTGLWLGYRLGHSVFSTAFNYDFGQMYRSFSFRAGVRVELDALGGHR